MVIFSLNHKTKKRQPAQTEQSEQHSLVGCWLASWSLAACSQPRSEQCCAPAALSPLSNRSCCPLNVLWRLSEDQASVARRHKAPSPLCKRSFRPCRSCWLIEGCSEQSLDRGGLPWTKTTPKWKMQNVAWLVVGWALTHQARQRILWQDSELFDSGDCFHNTLRGQQDLVMETVPCVFSHKQR